MLLILAFISLLLFLAIIYLLIDGTRQIENYKKRIAILENIIMIISKEQSLQHEKIKISNDLNDNLKKSKSVLSNSIFDLNYELFEMLSKNNLLKK